eukprot:scaffold3860_cov151-Skeletonema_dohrnii-CCMP3373.AAC.1
MLRCRQRYAIFHATKSDGQRLSYRHQYLQSPPNPPTQHTLTSPKHPLLRYVVVIPPGRLLLSVVAFAHYTKSVTGVGESMRLSGDLDIKSSSPTPGRDAPGNKAERHSRGRSFTSWAHIDPLRLSAAGFGGADDSSALRYRRPVHHGVAV